MYKKSIGFFVCLVGVLSFSTATFALIKLESSTPNSLEKKETNIMVQANHPSFTIKLRSNPTTGYSWLLTRYDHHLIIPIKHYYQADKTDRMGSGGFEYWSFKVKPSAFVVPQQTSLHFVYRQAFSIEQVAQEEKYTLVIH